MIFFFIYYSHVHFVTVNVVGVSQSTSTTISASEQVANSLAIPTTTLIIDATSDGLITPAYVPSDISFLIMMIGGLLLTVTY